MTRTTLALLLVLIASSLYLVRTSYEARRLFSALDRARAEERQLDTDFKRLDAERQAQATHVRVERVARERLHMRAAEPGVTHYVTDTVVAPNAASGAVTASASGAAGTRVTAAAGVSNMASNTASATPGRRP